MADLPDLVFEPIDEESKFDKVRRANIGYTAGIYTLNQTLEILGLPQEEGADVRKDGQRADMGELPRQNMDEGAVEMKDVERDEQ